jgi:hypothetical protein
MPTFLSIFMSIITTLSLILLNSLMFEEKDVIGLSNTLTQPLTRSLNNIPSCMLPLSCNGTSIVHKSVATNTLPNITATMPSSNTLFSSTITSSNSSNNTFPNANNGLQTLYIKQQNELLALIQKQQQDQTYFLQKQLQQLFGNTFYQQQQQQQQQPSFNTTYPIPNTNMKNNNLNIINPIQK